MYEFLSLEHGYRHHSIIQRRKRTNDIRYTEQLIKRDRIQTWKVKQAMNDYNMKLWVSLHTLTRAYCSHASSVAMTVFFSLSYDKSSFDNILQNISYRQRSLSHCRQTSLPGNSHPHLRPSSWATFAQCAAESILFVKPPCQSPTISTKSTVLHYVVQL